MKRTRWSKQRAKHTVKAAAAARERQKEPLALHINGLGRNPVSDFNSSINQQQQLPGASAAKLNEDAWCMDTVLLFHSRVWETARQPRGMPRQTPRPPWPVRRCGILCCVPNRCFLPLGHGGRHMCQYCRIAPFFDHAEFEFYDRAGCRRCCVGGVGQRPSVARWAEHCWTDRDVSRDLQCHSPRARGVSCGSCKE